MVCTLDKGQEVAGSNPVSFAKSNQQCVCDGEFGIPAPGIARGMEGGKSPVNVGR